MSDRILDNPGTPAESGPLEAEDTEVTIKLRALRGIPAKQTKASLQTNPVEIAPKKEGPYALVTETHQPEGTPWQYLPITQPETEKSRRKWLLAFKESFPIYSAIHIAFLMSTIFGQLFILHNFSSNALHIAKLWQSWNHWDTSQYYEIAVLGYNASWRTAFFPLYPMLIRGIMLVIHNPLIAALIISNVSGIGILIVLYLLVRNDFGPEIASRTVLYLSIFPTAFFLAAGYTESVFLFLTLLTFYNMRTGHWWMAGIAGLLASLTRSSGLFLALPFCYEYLMQHGFTFQNIRLKNLSLLKNLRFDLLAGALIPLGTAIFAAYCYWKFHDLLAFSHAQISWNRAFNPPWFGFNKTIQEIQKSNGFLSFTVLHDFIDMGLDLVMLVVLILMFVGPWKLQKTQWSYAIYAAACYLFILMVPVIKMNPLQSTSRFVLVLFPAFIILARIGKNRGFHYHYLLISASLLFLMLNQFLIGNWIV